MEMKIDVLTPEQGAARLRDQIAALPDADLALLVCVASASLNELDTIPAGLPDAIGKTEAELETWSAIQLGGGLGVDCLPVSAQLVLGRFPDGLNADGSNLPTIVLTDGAGVPLGHHSALIDGWKMPALPEGYDTVACILFADDKYEFDFYDSARAAFSSEAGIDAIVQWPWIAGYGPDKDDWRRLGFSVFD
jgi:hypothetical protein